MTRRMLDSRVWTNNRFGQMPIMARLLLLGIINLADDQGRLMAHPIYLRSQIFPYDDVAIGDIGGWLQLFIKNGTMAVYQSDGKDYIQLLNWWEYQSLQYPAPSEYPAQSGWQDRVRYNAKGGTVLTYNWITVKGERLPDTCDSHGNLLGYSTGQPSYVPPESPPEIPHETPSESPSGTPDDAPLEAPIQLEDQYNTDQQKQEDDEEDTQAREPVAQAWFDYYGEEVPDNLKERLEKLEIECNVDGVIHGIAASVRAKTRTFRYIAECARNYIPPSPNDDYVNSNGYSVNLSAQDVDFMPGVHPMTPPANAQPPPPLPPPMSHDDPWAVALAELSPTLPGVAAAWLKDSRLEPSGELAGVPLYRVMVLTDTANIGWLTQQAEPAIRRKLGSLFGKRILVEIIAATVPSIHGVTA